MTAAKSSQRMGKSGISSIRSGNDCQHRHGGEFTTPRGLQGDSADAVDDVILALSYSGGRGVIRRMERIKRIGAG